MLQFVSAATDIFVMRFRVHALADDLAAGLSQRASARSRTPPSLVCAEWFRTVEPAYSTADVERRSGSTAPSFTCDCGHWTCPELRKEGYEKANSYLVNFGKWGMTGMPGCFMAVDDRHALVESMGGQ